MPATALLRSRTTCVNSSRVMGPEEEEDASAARCNGASKTRGRVAAGTSVPVPAGSGREACASVTAAAATPSVAPGSIVMDREKSDTRLIESCSLRLDDRRL